ncbi:MAG: hypothetical protein GDA48_27710 [Hormoscilla sp. GM102CHS1]|nr:hypothetical protein [Hormoscilla sp. GM102CHS1]
MSQTSLLSPRNHILAAPVGKHPLTTDSQNLESFPPQQVAPVEDCPPELEVDLSTLPRSHRVRDSHLENISNKNLKHISKHLPEFQQYDTNLTLDDIVKLGQEIAKRPENFTY